jgi:hypothetical protein
VSFSGVVFDLDIKPNELQVVYRKPNTVTTTKLRRLEWAGHLVRMSDGRAVKEVFVGKPDGRRKAGRPNLRRLGCIENTSEVDGC